HPEVINEDAGSLLAGVDRQALLWTIDLDGDGEIERAHLERAEVRAAEQLSYAKAQQRIDSGGEDEPLVLLKEVGLRRQDLERARGAVSLALPSQEVVPTAEGEWVLEYDRPLAVEGWNA
ncbi:MAG: RNB domain-containing ribonuclease, partial [Actinobacteria bacterium]|nr:RNB domain-containing ribonuclease [Actinomycetota bacterium]NIS35248.1 RNB domain-containing ribonuclease [Actinomycetota bacterium]NIT98014.1 RNB domain-containing ribonuclease [Actinomycetota bacterium]NIU21649.1 RNB domain-containing ribonuclease [Actinomycetota bacterium]NIU69962.1 RNB domain-containing ribonuclease [Actinomycetota bacterium]